MMLFKGILAGAVVACGLWQLEGCKDKNNPLYDGSPSSVVFPPSNVSYGRHVQPLFNQACTYSGCHDDGPHTSPLKLTSYSSTVFSIPGVVVPGQPDQSTLILRILGQGVRMPPGDYGLNDNQVLGLRAWVSEGAKNN
jgi:hypothetical protein